jgi:hypothetical protein
MSDESDADDDLQDEDSTDHPDTLEFHRQNWLDNRCGDSLCWLYDTTVNGVEGLKTKEEVVAIFGQPDEGSDDADWSYSADADVGFILQWGGPNRNELIAWKMP